MSFMPSRLLRRLSPLAIVFVCSACAMGASEYKFGAKETRFTALPGWQSDNSDEAIATFLDSCDIMARKPHKKTESGITISKSVWSSLCSDAKNSAAGGREQSRQFFERRFTPFRITNNDKEKGLFTGYYEPTLYGSTQKFKDFKYPLYMTPSGSTRTAYTHAAINRGALKGKNLELMYVDDPVMLFFMQIQGSGRVVMRDGRVLKVGYSGQNGQEYVAIGKLMGDEGVLPKDKINFFTIRKWLYDNPSRAMAMMERNPSYVFFKVLDKTKVVGAIGSDLTPWRSMAVDRRFIPYGLPLFLETELPALPGSSPASFNRIMVAQDTGGAIKGPVRGDIFFGAGDSAEYMAGYMKGKGTYSLMVPNEVADQLR